MSSPSSTVSAFPHARAGTDTRPRRGRRWQIIDADERVFEPHLPVAMQHKDRLAVRELAVFLAALGAASIVAASVVFFLGAHGVLEVGQL